ncbi:RNA polymerase sigma factor [Flagellimonas sediminis]|uniref:Sigma-70 family RNA polymerase sigma factor n=1 Tax=Flagellimonas sediminis TaxID=2696468 RepID=A0A6I5KVT3_9FLAO|nr:sigma-70 family RNA polymerase sigma factor [Allomuricauda sediminis]NDV42552.1 sigma-70 family RNA polymerase sigma factor [Allomuricauda sediminis]
MGNTHQQVDKIVNGFRKNDSETMRETYQEVYPKVRAHILKNNGNEDQAKDIFQEAFVACWRNIKEDRFVEGNVSGYLFTIAKNKWTDFLRSSDYKKTINTDSQSFLKVVQDDPMPKEDILEEEQNRNAMKAALAQLGENCRNLLKMFYFERRSMEEISKEMGMAPNSARNQKYRCMEKLRNLCLQIKNNER